uniref:DNA-directed RNA polymerase n=1 Tax=Heterorhabditis bacteriophora TaxID=37862 RepID=A0A1I7W8K7_HETBA
MSGDMFVDPIEAKGRDLDFLLLIANPTVLQIRSDSAGKMIRNQCPASYVRQKVMSDGLLPHTQTARSKG